jgi:hypothetical protein
VPDTTGAALDEGEAGLVAASVGVAGCPESPDFAPEQAASASAAASAAVVRMDDASMNPPERRA